MASSNCVISIINQHPSHRLIQQASSLSASSPIITDATGSASASASVADRPSLDSGFQLHRRRRKMALSLAIFHSLVPPAPAAAVPAFSCYPFILPSCPPPASTISSPPPVLDFLLSLLSIAGSGGVRGVGRDVCRISDFSQSGRMAASCSSSGVGRMPSAYQAWKMILLEQVRERKMLLLDGAVVSEVGYKEPLEVTVAVTVDARDTLEATAGEEALPPPNDQSVDGHSLTAASIVVLEKEMGKDEAGSDLADVSEIMIEPGNESEMAQVAPGIDQSDLTSDTLVGGNESSASQEERFNSVPSEVVGVPVRNNDSDVAQSLKSGGNGSEIAGTFQTVTSSESSEEVDRTEILESQEVKSFLPHKSSAKDEDEVGALEVRMASVTVDRIVTTPAMQSELVSLKKLITSSGAASLPHPSKALSGGEDSYFVACENWFGVADGVGQWSLEGINAGLYARELMENCAQLLSKWGGKYSSKPEELLVESAKKTRSLGSSTALVAHFDNEVLHVANLGDSGFVIVRNGATFSRSTPMVYGFNFPRQIQKGDDPSRQIERYRVGLVEGDVIVTGTDGLFDNIYDEEIASIVSKSLLENLTPKEIADILAIRAQEVGKSTPSRTPFTDSAQAAGYTTFTGGKLDDVTVIVSLVVSSNKQ